MCLCRVFALYHNDPLCSLSTCSRQRAGMPWSVPRRFLQHLQQFQLLPSEKQVLRAFLRSCRRPARPSLRVNRLKAPTKATKAWLRSHGWDLDPVQWCDSGWFLTRNDEDRGKPTRKAIGKSLPHFLGHLYSQEAASMLPAEVLKALLNEAFPVGENSLLVLDLCAAPGGKSIQLAEILDELGSPLSLLVANDPNPQRALRLRSNLLRCGVESVVVSELPGEDFMKMVETPIFDAILVDAPCSAEGNVRRDRRVLDRWRARNGPFNEAYLRLLKRQEVLLNSAWRALKPGGCMVYSTCTFNYFENEGQCEKFASSNPDARILDLSFKDWGFSCPKSKYLRIWPHDFDTEGFFVAAFQKDKMHAESFEKCKTHFPRIPRFHDLFSTKFRLLDWRLADQIKKCLQDQVGFCPQNPHFLVEDHEHLWLLPLRMRLRWADHDTSSSSEPMAECAAYNGDHVDLSKQPSSFSNCMFQRSFFSKLKMPGLCVGQKVALKRHGRQGSGFVADEFLMLAGDRYKKSSQMTLVDWAALEMRICDTTASRNAHLSLLAEGETHQVHPAFTKMLQARLQPDGASFSALVTALVNGNNIRLAKDLADASLLRRESFNKILDGLASRGDHASIRKIMLEMRERKLAPDVVSYNTLLKSWRKVVHPSNSSTILEEMAVHTVRPNHITYSSLMSLAADRGDVASVEDLMQQAKRNTVKIGTFHFNILLNAFVKVSDFQSAQTVLGRMRQDALEPDVVTYTTLMQGQNEEVALSLLDDMQKDLVLPNSVSFTTLISSLTRSQQINTAMKLSKNLHQEAKSKKSQISSHVACSILHLCTKAAKELSDAKDECFGSDSLNVLNVELASFASEIFELVPEPDAACRHALAGVLKATKVYQRPSKKAKAGCGKLRFCFWLMDVDGLILDLIWSNRKISIESKAGHTAYHRYEHMEHYGIVFHGTLAIDLAILPYSWAYVCLGVHPLHVIWYANTTVLLLQSNTT